MDNSSREDWFGPWVLEWMRAGNGLRLIARLPIPAMVRLPGTARYLAFLPREWSREQLEAQMKLYLWDFWLATFGLEQTRAQLRDYLAHQEAGEHGAA